jgi:hypothetical protein
MQQPTGKQKGLDLVALVGAKGKALHRVREEGSHSTHGGRHQSPLQGSQQKHGTIHDCCCTIAADGPLHSKINLHKFTQVLSTDCKCSSHAATQAFQNTIISSQTPDSIHISDLSAFAPDRALYSRL